ncbi:MAG: glutathione S-transferase [Alphaproteobacteria bacterium]|nr:MAG: glutathione S-transferase [Alphaproteobacteria bacterium]
MADYSLYCFVQSGNAYKAALMLRLTGRDWQPVWVDFFNGGTRTPQYRAINEMGEVPVLVDHGEGDLTLSQSGVILHHLADRTGRFGPQTGAEQREVLRWMLWDNHKLTSYIATYRFLRKFAGKEGAPETEFMKGRALAALKLFEGHMAGRDWVAADRPTIADISCCGYLFWPADFGADWHDYPGIAAWLDRIRTLDDWAPPEALLPSGPIA